MEFNHVSVLLNESIEGLNIKKDGIYIDGTLGAAGHSLKICEQLSEKGRLIGIDQDQYALTKAASVLELHKDKVTFVHNNFSNILEILKELKIEYVDGVLLDLGVSSHQLDESARGFSYMHDANLDMRMDTSAKFSAFDVVNTYSENELSKIITEYGEERWSKRIAQFIIKERSIKPINTTFELVSVIKAAIPKAARIDGPHPAKRTFQAIRIEVNGELDILKQTVLDINTVLNKNGRLCIITFHSLEDRIIKNAFRDLQNPCTCPREFPICMCRKTKQMEVITRKPIISNENELLENHRARSAKLRIAEKV